MQKKKENKKQKYWIIKDTQRKNTNLLAIVCLFIEVREQEIEQDSMGANEVCKLNWIVAIVLEQQLERMDHNQHELDHLDDGEVLLPPKVFLHRWTHGGQHVVRVHDDVHECVQETEECAVAAGSEFHTPPNGGGHQTVMDDMQCGHLIVTLAHHKEHGVKEFGEFREEVPPATFSYLQNNEFEIDCTIVRYSNGF